MKKIRWIHVLFVLVFSILIVSCSNDEGPNPPSNNLVEIHDNFFFPSSIEVAVGRTVLWRSVGSVIHTVTSGTPTVNPGAIFDSGNVNPGGGFQFVFSTPGTYPYFCRVHGVAMTGSITVR